MAKLLVVEQDDERRARYRETFEKANYEVIEARSATEMIVSKDSGLDVLVETVADLLFA